MLSRRRSEVIVIAESVRISVVDIRGNRVRLGITAPVGIPIRHEELRAKGTRTNADLRFPEVRVA
jgi:carbon storage regulator